MQRLPECKSCAYRCAFEKCQWGQRRSTLAVPGPAPTPVFLPESLAFLWPPVCAPGLTQGEWPIVSPLVPFKGLGGKQNKTKHQRGRRGSGG